VPPVRCESCRLGLLHRHCRIADCGRPIDLEETECRICGHRPLNAWAGVGFLLLAVLLWGVALTMGHLFLQPLLARWLP